MTPLPCAIYTRKSSEEGLEQGFNSLDAQREACEAFILSQKAQGWKVVDAYDDGGFSGGNVERPGLQRLLADIALRRIKVIVVYKVDRLTRSLADFAKLVELFDAHGVSFVSVTQQFNTTSSMGRLTLNVLLSFAQFEREVTGERIRDKIAASKRKGMWMGGFTPMGYLPHERTLVVDEPHAQRVRDIYDLYLELRSVKILKAELDRRGWTTPEREGRRIGGGRPFTRGHLYRLLANPIYAGQIAHKGVTYPGQHPAIIDAPVFKAVQALLAHNAQKHEHRTDVAEPSLLAGVVFDGTGQRLKPTHSKKGPKRYRYYFSAPDDAGATALRIPAPELEGVVLQALRSLLVDSGRMLDAIGDVTAAEVTRRLELLQAASRQLDSPGVELIATLIERVVVFTDRLEIWTAPSGLWYEGTAVPESERQVLSVPVELRRAGLAMRLVVRDPNLGSARGPDRRLIELLVKAQRWFDALKSGEAPSVAAIAGEHGLEVRDVTRTIYLAFLDPALLQRIVAGERPPGLSVRRALELAPLSLDWSSQAFQLGFQ